MSESIRTRRRKGASFAWAIIIILFFAFFLLSFSFDNSELLENKRNRPIIGAIRWDGWIGNSRVSGVGLEVERSLGPHKFHYRAPFFSKERGQDSIYCREVTQSVMDQDIKYAKYANIDYWAFCYYAHGSGLDTARTLYLNSKVKRGLNWCAILGVYNNLLKESEIKWIVNQFKERYYQKVLSGRPLVYIYGGTHSIKLKQLLRIKELSLSNGIKEPYFVLMSTDSNNPQSYADGLGVNSISRYNSWGEGGNGSAYFPDIPKADQEGWERMKNFGFQIVPWVTTGRNMKPRIEHQVSWQNVSADSWIDDGSPKEIADNLHAAIEWVKLNRTVTEANTIIIYAWNEFDEGGWICPTLNNNLGRLEAIRQVLK